MTMTEPTRDAVASDVASQREVKAAAAREWRESGGKLTAAELAQRHGRSERWARGVIAKERPADGKPPLHIAERPPRLNGTPVRGTAAPSRAPARPGRAVRVPLPLRLLTGGALSVVLTVTAVVSYSHIRDLATMADVGWAGWLPLSLDGMVLASLCSWMVDQRRGRGVSLAAKAGLVVGLVASLAANALAVDPGLASLRAVRLALALYPPLALALTIHLATRVLGDD